MKQLILILVLMIVPLKLSAQSFNFSGISCANSAVTLNSSITLIGTNAGTGALLSGGTPRINSISGNVDCIDPLVINGEIIPASANPIYIHYADKYGRVITDANTMPMGIIISSLVTNDNFANAVINQMTAFAESIEHRPPIVSEPYESLRERIFEGETFGSNYKEY